jgi:hypothetical protein
MITHEEFLKANRRAEELRRTTPHAVSARYDRRIGRVVVRLSSNLEISFSPRDAQGLETATGEQLQEIEIESDGFGLHFPALDADLHIPSLLEGFMGSKKWMAARLGAQGGKARSAAKTKASRENGRLGGRPKKAATAA